MHTHKISWICLHHIIGWAGLIQGISQLINAVTMQVAVRNGKHVGFQVGFSLNNKTTTKNSTSHMPYLCSKLFPTVLYQCKFKCIHQKSVACKGRLHIKIKFKKWKYNTVFISAYSATHSLRNVLTVCPAKQHGRPSQWDRHSPHWSGTITLSTLSPCRKTETSRVEIYRGHTRKTKLTLD